MDFWALKHDSFNGGKDFSSGRVELQIRDRFDLTDFAEVDDVLVMRKVDGQSYIGLYNIKAIQRGNYPDPVLYPNDIVTVGDSPARRRLQSIIPFVPILSTAAIIIDRLGR